MTGYSFTADVKDPDDVLKHDHDLRSWLKPDETVEEFDVFSSDPALVVDQVRHEDGRIYYRVSGGVLGAEYIVTCRVKTSTGRRKDRGVRYRIGQQ